MTGKDIVKTSAGQGQSGGWLVYKTFNQNGAEEFGALTTKLSELPFSEDDPRKKLAIVLDGICFSAPRINVAILGGSAQIDGMESQEEAKNLAEVLQSGSLPVKIKIDGESRTDATLGSKAIDSGLKTIVIGITLVMLFMLYFYRLPGTFASVSGGANCQACASTVNSSPCLVGSSAKTARRTPITWLSTPAVTATPRSWPFRSRTWRCWTQTRLQPISSCSRALARRRLTPTTTSASGAPSVPRVPIVPPEVCRRGCVCIRVLAI